MSSTYPQVLERLRYWQGQTLRSVDWRDQLRFDARRRGLHNRSLHSVDGVGFGLTVTPQIADPTQYDVACGVAYDCTGRELILQRPRSVPAPAESMWLILRFRPAPTRHECCPVPDPGCTLPDASLLEQDVELVWHPVGSVERLNGVALAKFTPTGPDPAFRPRQARPLARPRLAWGRTVRGNTPWEPWSIDEPDGLGGIRRKVVGVETRIDTSAAGFTREPKYFVSIESPAWDVTTAEFAPAFFPHVADPTVDGFICRLLMLETARRRYSASDGTARVLTTTRAAGDQLVVELDDATPFQRGDMIALLRPRARSVVQVKQASGTDLTLSAALEDVEVGTTVLAVGNLPRTARVTDAPQSDPAMLVTFATGPVAKKWDVLLRTSDQALAVLGGSSKGKRTVANPFPSWTAADPIQIAPLATSVDVKKAKLSANGTAMELEFVALPATITTGTMLALLDQQKTPMATAGKVLNPVGNTIEVQPLLSASDLAKLKKVALFIDITVNTLEPKTAGAAVKVDSNAAFAIGDVVAAATDPSVVTTVDGIKGAHDLVLASAIPLQKGSLLVAANWRCATAVSSVGAAGTNEVTVGRKDAVPPGSFVARREDADFPSPVTVKSVNGALVTLAAPIADLARLDTLAVGVFPRIATVVSQQPQPEQIQVAEAGILESGDEVVVLGATGPTAVVRVASASGTSVLLGESLGALSPGQQLAVVHFRERALLTAVDTTDPKNIELDRDVDPRPDDIVGVLTHSADNSNPGLVAEVKGDSITLWPGIVHGDGIVPAGWIDGGVVGPAAVSYLPQAWFPASQPFVRLVSTDGLAPSERAIAYGLDQLTGRYVSRGVRSLLYDPTGKHVVLIPVNPGESYSLRPETLSLITTFDTDFPSAFATFAQKQEISVSWIGCQQEFPPVSGCPAQQADDPCGAPTSPEK